MVDEEDGDCDSSSGGNQGGQFFFFLQAKKRLPSGRGWPLTLPIDKIYGDVGPWENAASIVALKLLG